MTTPNPIERKECTCSSFFTVRGYHKKGCPSVRYKITSANTDVPNSIEKEELTRANIKGKTCKCACHENKLKQPYEHDTKCCEYMNGSIPNTEKRENSVDGVSYMKGQQSGRKTTKEKTIKLIEGEMLNRILYIGDEIPEALMEDKRPKFILLGCPDDLIKKIKEI